ncbi:MAG: MBL fold metallo-hydrolase [Actinophytocola sp.]|nr:MBL fold metallo-hydrolase [Actinophytocola sp.]
MICAVTHEFTRTATAGRWLQVARGVFARRYAELDQTLGLIIGERRCLVVDTGRDEVHGAELATAIRELTDLPWTVVITHAHFDHFFGTAAFLPCRVLAHARCREVIESDAEPQRAEWVRRYNEQDKPEFATRLAEARVFAPDDLFTERIELDLGGRTAVVLHPGRGHTDHDVIVHVPDAGVLFAGDLVEQGAPPAVGPDAHLLDWPKALDTVLVLRPDRIVPGHGEPVDRAFVAAQRAELGALGGTRA